MLEIPSASTKDPGGIPLQVAALAVAEFRQGALVPKPSPGKESTIAIERPAVEYRIRLKQGLSVGSEQYLAGRLGGNPRAA
jgi:hypothetical protein